MGLVEEIPEFTLVRVVADDIEAKGNGYFVPFQLSGTPDGSWRQAFEAARKGMLSAEMRPAEIQGARILVQLHGQDNKQAQVDYLTKVIAEATARSCANSIRRPSNLDI
jgi:hypothetical protein